MGYFSKGLENEYETAVVNEPSVFEPLKFYCSMSCYNNRIFKTTFGYESYLSKVPFKYRKYLIKIRTRNHNLPIETGRWGRTLRVPM